jgi:hypothetical protein
MEVKNIIYGSLALAVIGGGAYLFLRNKKAKDTLKLAELQQGGILGTGTLTGTLTGGTTPTPDKVLDSASITNAQAQANQQETSKQIQAQGLASQIAIKRSMKKSGFNLTPNERTTNSFITIDILRLSNQIKDLGYKEVNGVAVKL